MRLLLHAVLLCAAALVPPAWGKAPPVLVELYTSQGCSSCPPVDAFLRDQLAQRDDVIALALHVDYWDYIGWKDSFASPAHRRRQQHYARRAGERTIYTPQMIIGGRDHVVGNRIEAIKRIIARQRQALTSIQLEGSITAGTLYISLATAQPAAENLTVQLVRYTPLKTVEIRRGENAGRTLSYANIVTSWDMLGEWDTRAPLDMMVPIEGSDAVVVIVQRKGYGAIEAALRVRPAG
ncbi:MAG: DUF1223 domain-containing protein [Rhodobacteraceae bacterium]|nr:DUF1223 domain-containing protein [Paracoccaceae bacterium]